MKTWDEFYPFIAPEVSGCPTPTLDHHIRTAARAFCERSGAWREWADTITADGTTNRFDYDLTPRRSTLVRVAQALRNDDEELTVRAAGRALPPDWQGDDSDMHYAQDTLVHFDDEVFVVFPAPVAGDTFRLEMVLMPTIDATGIDSDAVFNRHAEAIAMGAKATLMAMQRRDWTDLKLAGDYRQQFERAICDAANLPTARSQVGRPRRQRVGIR